MTGCPWSAELELAILDDELDVLLTELSEMGVEDDDLVELLVDPGVGHLSFQRQLLHALHLALSFIQRWVGFLEVGEDEVSEHVDAEADPEVAEAVGGEDV